MQALLCRSVQNGKSEVRRPLVLAEIVRVELVDPWWQQLLPLAALGISLFSVVLTMVFRYGERVRVRVTAHKIVPHQSRRSGDLRVSVRNLSRGISTSATGVTMLVESRIEGRKDVQRIPTGAENQPPRLISPGEQVDVSFGWTGVLHALREHDRVVESIRFEVNTTHGPRTSKHDRQLMRDLYADLDPVLTPGR